MDRQQVTTGDQVNGLIKNPCPPELLGTETDSHPPDSRLLLARETQAADTNFMERGPALALGEESGVSPALGL